MAWLLDVWADRRKTPPFSLSLPTYDPGRSDWDAFLGALVEAAFQSQNPATVQQVVSEALDLHGPSRAILSGAADMAERHGYPALALRWRQKRPKS